MTITTTGDEDANHNVVIADAAGATAATTVTIVSAGSIVDATAADAVFAAATTVSFTADDDSIVTADLATGATFASSDADGVTFTAGLAAVDTLVMTGSNALTITIDAADLDTETVTNTNTATSTLNLTDSGNHDLSGVATSVKLRLGSDFDTRNTTVATNATVLLDAEMAQTGTVTVTSKDATLTTNVINIATTDTVTTTTADEVANVAALTLAEFATVNIDATAANLTLTGDLTATEATSFVITGDENVTFTQVVGKSTGSTINAAALTGVLTYAFDATANLAETVTSGTGNDIFTVSAASNSGNTFSVTSGTGTDTVTMTAATNITYNGGAGVDTLKLDAATTLDFSTSTLSLTAVEQLDIDGGITVSAAILDGVTMLIAATDGDVANDVLTIKMNDVDFNGSSLAFASSFGAAGTDSVAIDGSAIALAQTITGTSKNDTITTSSGGDTITAGEGIDTITAGAGTDVINLTETTSVLDTVVIDNSNTGVDVITGFTQGTDKIAHGANDTTETTAASNPSVFASFATALGTAGNALDWSATIALTDTADVFELTTALDTDVTLTSSSTGAQLFEALSSDAGVISAITIGAATTDAYLVVYQNSNAYVWHISEGDTAASVQSDEVTLEAVINGVSAGALAAGDFVVIA